MKSLEKLVNPNVRINEYRLVFIIV
jgi:hypothetical protein